MFPPCAKKQFDEMCSLFQQKAFRKHEDCVSRMLLTNNNTEIVFSETGAKKQKCHPIMRKTKHFSEYKNKRTSCHLPLSQKHNIMTSVCVQAYLNLARASMRPRSSCLMRTEFEKNRLFKIKYRLKTLLVKNGLFSIVI